jgi:hypothetical protein
VFYVFKIDFFLLTVPIISFHFGYQKISPVLLLLPVTIFVVFVRMSSMGLGLSNGGKVSGLGVLHFGCVDWHSIVDAGHMVVVVMFVVVLVVFILMVFWGGVVASGGQFCHMGSTGMLNLFGVDWDAVLDGGVVVTVFAIVLLVLMVMIVVVMFVMVLVVVTGVVVSMGGGNGVSSSVGSLGQLDFGCVDWDAVVDHWHVVVVGRALVVMVQTGDGFSVGGSMGGFQVLHFLGLLGSFGVMMVVFWGVAFGIVVSTGVQFGQMGGAGVLHLSSVDWHSVLDCGVVVTVFAIVVEVRMILVLVVMGVMIV